MIRATTVFNDLVGRVADRGRSLMGTTAPRSVVQMCDTLLTGKGEATGLALARAIFDRYDGMDWAAKHDFFTMLRDRFGVDRARTETALRHWQEGDESALRDLHIASEPRSQELIRRLNRAPGGTRRLVAMRNDLLHLMVRLRDPQHGCPWDLQQDYASIVPHALEEAYEVADAIESGDFDHLPGELGDLLFQVVYYSQLAKEEGRFEFDAVVDGITRKLLRRHPHVFPDGDLYGSPELPRLDEAAIKLRWEEIKAEERAEKSAVPEQLSLLDDVPSALPALSRAAKLQKRTAQVGFDWPDALPVVDKVREELDEVLEAMSENDPEAIAEEIGDLLFVTVNLARHLKVDPENALRAANRKFERRFRFIEQALRDSGRPIENCDLEELDALWGEAKKAEKIPT